MPQHRGTRRGELKNRDWLASQYVDGGRSCADLARELGCSQNTVHRALKRHGIPTRPAGGKSPSVAIGDRYGRLTVVARLDQDRHGNYRYECRCDCGGSRTTLGRSLRAGLTQSCGCLHRETAAARGKANAGLNTTHGHGKEIEGQRPSRTYKTWQAMRQRCNNPKDPSWRHYGGRGITVCAEWGTFTNFLADMGVRPEGMSIDRIDNDGNYEKMNCRWATAKDQRANQR